MILSKHTVLDRVQAMCYSLHDNGKVWMRGNFVCEGEIRDDERWAFLCDDCARKAKLIW